MASPSLLWLAGMILGAASAQPYVELRATDPVVLDAVVSFKAVVHQEEDVDSGRKLVFKWSDNASPAHWSEQEVTGDTASLNLTYPSATYEPRRYQMMVSVYVVVGVFREWLTENSIDFLVTEDLNGHFSVNGHLSTALGPWSSSSSQQYQPILVSTKNKTVATLKLSDPTDFLRNASLSYFWFVNDTNFGVTVDPHFEYQFGGPAITMLEVTAIAHFPNGSSSSENNLPPPRLRSSSPPSEVVSPDKRGVFRATLRSAVPVSRLDVTGEVWIKHGDLVELVVSCDGSGPWTYCWKVVNKDYNVTGNETCHGLDPGILKTSCSFPITWYFLDPGEYAFLMQAADGLSSVAEVVAVTVYQVQKQMPISFVLAPALSSVAIVAIVIAAFFFYRSYNTNTSIETADFDFTLHDEDDQEIEERTFFERLRDSMMNVFSSTGDSISHVSSTASSVNRAVVGGHHYHPHRHQSSGDAAASANIHYGSIS